MISRLWSRRRRHDRLPGSETKCFVVKILAVSSLKSIFCALSVHCIRGNPHEHWRFAKEGEGGTPDKLPNSSSYPRSLWLTRRIISGKNPQAVDDSPAPHASRRQIV